MTRRTLSFSEDDMQDMEAMYRNGYSTAEIADKYGCLPGSVWSRLKKRGVEMRRVGFKRPKPSIHSHGYIIYDGEYVHRIVAAAWLDRELKENEVVHHKNGDVTDNRPCNLEVCASNAEHLSEHHVVFWTEEKKEQLRRMTERGVTASEAARRFGVTMAAIYNQRRWLNRPRPSRAKNAQEAA